ncbi:hypothetical protein N7532_003366 [Penicillium argentinense]|uniref:Mitochondrial respiratory complex I chaperone n=1 Tax=Penicillium argentinense TaxID=1131581 RepID=A0A9W9FMD2_9EURO|nr:uncharacterized protein N7532_003366 [Penicillium argentinense]KAJ5102837.1 hypothetical protein N7532_003366 [Penicillium argentinense]
MQSHLSRRVFRAILNNEPLHFSRCRRTQLLHTISPARVRPSLLNLNNVSRRTLFAFNLDLSSGAGPAVLPTERGLKPMSDLKRSLQDRSRPPPNFTLAKAFQSFFTTRVEAPGSINLFEARLLSITWKHMKAQQAELDDKEWDTMFSIESLERMLYVFSESEILPEARDTTLKVARFAYNELCTDHGFGANSISRPALLIYINLLSINGCPEEARHTIIRFGGQMRGAKPSPWLTVLKGFALKDDRRQMRKVTQELGEYGVKFDQESQKELIDILVAQGLFKAVQTVYECPIVGQHEPAVAAKVAAIKFAILKSDLKWAKPVFESLPHNTTPETAGITLLWEAAQGNDATSLADIIKLWSSTSPQLKEALKITDFNSLIEYANAVQCPELAMDVQMLAEKSGFIPNEQTYLLQLESAVKSGDVTRTLGILEHHVDPSTLTGDNLPLANQLIVMLCSSPQRDTLFEKISALLDPLFQENVRLEPRTVAELTRMLLYRHEFDAVSELLRPRLGTYDSEGKTLIRTAFTDFVMDPSQEDDHVWEIYELFKMAFPEAGVSIRTEIMSSFFERNRSDLAALVFGHMRQAEDLTRRPKPDTYARCLQGIARAADATNLELVHNMLKLDLEVEANTRIMNGLMLAYTECEMPEKSMEIFKEILRSDEGPSHKTLAIFFKACGRHSDGAHEAIKMLKKIKKLDIDLDRRLYSSYIEALAAQCEFDLATEAIDKMQAETGVPPTSTTIGLFYNASPFNYWKDKVEQWALEKYPDLWAHLSETNLTVHDEGPKFDGIVNETWV